MKVKYIGNHKEVNNVYGVFKKDEEKEVKDEIGNILIKCKKEFVMVGEKLTPNKEK
jgi:hypothetical protein